MDPDLLLQTRSSPNLARHRSSQQGQQHSQHLHPHHAHHSSPRYPAPTHANVNANVRYPQHRHRSVHLKPSVEELDRFEELDDKSPEAGVQDMHDDGDKDEGSNQSKLTRSERKRMWRKNLSAEKLAKLRERDALRKRIERLNMSAEKRRDLRTKDTARKAALRRERRLGETVGGRPGRSSETTSTDTEQVSTPITRSLIESGASTSGGLHSRRSTRLRHAPSSSHDDESFTKIPVHSLLN